MYEQIARNKRRTVVYLVFFFVLWVAAGSLVGLLVGASTGSGSGAAPLFGDVVVGATLAGFLALVGIVFALTSGPRMVLAASGARPADPRQYRQLHNLVEVVAIGAGLPKPTVYIIDDPSPNAFATGTSPSRAAITVTTGLLATMNREELEAVLSHEMSHIRNYDVRLILVVSTLIGMAGLLASLIWRSAFLLRSRNRNSAQILVLVVVAGALLSVIAFVVGPVIRLALSRRREYLADASGVELTRNPVGLINALRKLQQNDTPFSRFNHATAAMCVDDPLQHHEKWPHRLFDTHPPIADRIRVLEGMLAASTL
jgi:heat shock protein HtpX